MNDDTESCPATNRNGEPCGHPAGWGTDNDSGPCKFHGGATEGAGPPEGNNNAVTVGAWAEDFVTDFLKDDEIDRVKDLSELLDEPTSAQEAAARAAAVAMEQFRRSGDPAFLRRFEQICDKAGLFPDEGVDINVDADHSFDSTEGVTAEFVTYENSDSDSEAADNE